MFDLGLGGLGFLGALAPGKGGPPPPYTYGWSRSRLAAWIDARNAVKGGTASCDVACIGDSRTFGVGSGGAYWTAAKTQSYPRQLAGLLATAAGIGAAEMSMMGDGRTNNLTTLQSAETRLVLGSGWVVYADDSFAGFMLANSTTTTACAFTPTQTFDTIEIYDMVWSGAAEWTVDVDGGAALATVGYGNPLRLRKTTVTCSRGTHTVNIKRTGTGAMVVVCAIIVRDSQTPRAHIHNMGASGSQASFWNKSTNVNNPLNAIGALAPKLSIIALGTNEYINGAPPATFKSNMGPIIQKCQQSGSAIIVAPSYCKTTLVSKATQDAMIAACYELSDQYSVPLIDNSRILGPWTAGAYYDDVHETAASYGAEAAALATALAWG